MREFLSQTAMTVLEEMEFKKRITDPSREFYLTSDKYYNRLSGRTKTKPEERMAMLNVLNEIRAEQSGKRGAKRRAKG